MNWFRWSQYFPNLTNLIVAHLEITPIGLLSDLTSLELLSELHLYHLQKDSTC